MKNNFDRIVIENVEPEIDCGSSPIKRVVDEKVSVQADGKSSGALDETLVFQKLIRKNYIYQ
ncbi:hypothetical protein AKJ49_01030 [candidate division MSBL1 archaeon SCGC-AAA382A03]|uniref:Alpha-1,4-glucan:maltose-1-phosphate maltosyltransferase domain-containing protein n=1 Tax=candidate division MSBL1 archaeon SCGC-AAA382A03 TaxID=1698278 RepID=A0A133VFY6_9EURY|nr:hypothetical protein AKJ49_01030 [candidate division MSBL1 archaeon SCGC-AAA382A03]